MTRQLTERAAGDPRRIEVSSTSIRPMGEGGGVKITYNYADAQETRRGWR